MTGRTHVLVDLDGTITDSFPGDPGSLRRPSRRAAPRATRRGAARASGRRSSSDCPLIGVPGDRLWAVIDRYRVHYEGGGLFENALYDGVVTMLDALAAAGLALSLATAKPEPTAVRIVEHFGLADRFTVARRGDVRARAAHQGRGDHALARLGIDRGRTS